MIMNMVSQTHNFNQAKQTSFNMEDPDSSSTQSTGQSCHAMVDMEGGKPQVHSISTETGCGGNYEKRNGCPTILSLGTSDFCFPPPGIDYNLSLAPIPYLYADPFLGGVLASYGPQTVMHSQMVGIGPARVPLPLNLPEEEPIYVNAKQYQGILRRRESRAKLEAQNKLVKARKPYLHESRHLHAMKRARGSGGRFLNTKQLQDMRPQKSDAPNLSILSPLHLTGNLHRSLEVDRSKNNSDTSMQTTSCSEVSNMSDNIFQGQHSKFAGFHLHVGRNLHGGDNMSNGSQYRVSVP